MTVLSAAFATGLLVLSVFHRGICLPQTDGGNTGAFQGVGPGGCRIPNEEYPKGISYEEVFAGLRDGSLVVIDVRPAAEIKKFGRLPGSYNVPFSEVDRAFYRMSPAEFESRYGFQRPKPGDTKVVLTCRTGGAARAAWRMLEPLGYCNVRVYFGSYMEWRARGGPLLF